MILTGIWIIRWLIRSLFILLCVMSIGVWQACLWPDFQIGFANKMGLALVSAVWWICSLIGFFNVVNALLHWIEWTRTRALPTTQAFPIDAAGAAPFPYQLPSGRVADCT